MIRKMIFTYENGNVRSLDLLSPGSYPGFAVTSITGVTPDEATINIGEVASSDIGYFSSSKLNTRPIEIKMAFQDIVDGKYRPVEKARLECYKWFPLKEKVTIEFVTDSRHCNCTGYIESNVIDIFSPNEGCIVKIKCPDPYFYDLTGLGNITTIFTGVENEFEFPFSNESLTTDLIEFSATKTSKQETFMYQGDGKSGIKATLHVTAPFTEDITIGNGTTNQTMILKYAAIKAKLNNTDVAVGDTIAINTNRGHKAITIKRGSTTYNLLNALDRNSKWIELLPGFNKLYYSIGALTTNPVSFSIESQVIYEGL